MSYLQISKRHPFYFISRRQINTREKKGGKQKKRNGPIRHKSTDVLHVFRARLARLSRPYRIMEMACTKRISHIWMGWCWILYAQFLYKLLFKKLKQQKTKKKHETIDPIKYNGGKRIPSHRTMKGKRTEIFAALRILRNTEYCLFHRVSSLKISANSPKKNLIQLFLSRLSKLENIIFYRVLSYKNKSLM